MRIAHIHWSLGTGGIETMLPDIANEQAKNNEVALVIINDWVEPSILAKVNQERVKVVLLNRHEGSKNPWPIIKLNLFLMKFRPDVIHCHAYNQVRLIFSLKGNLIRTIHNTNNIVSPREFPKFKKLITISKAVYDETYEQGFESVQIDNGIPINSINHTRNKFFSDGKLHFIQVSRLDIEQKGQDILIKALKIVKDDFKNDNFVMHFVGSGGDEEKLQQMVISLNMGNHVVFEGLKNQEWVYDNLCNYDLFIQPSRYEGFGMTLTEALQNACVPMAFDNFSVLHDILTDGENGYIIPSGNETYYAKRLLSLMSNDQTRMEMAIRGLESSNKFSIENVGNKWLELFNSLMI